MSKSAPAAPDYTGAAEAQAQSSREVTEQQTWANRPDQVTPFGTQSWSSRPQYDPTTGQTLNRWTQTTTLDPESQAALDAQQQLQAQRSSLASSMYGRVANEYGDIPDFSQFQTMGQAPQAMTFGGGDRYSQEAEDALMGRFESRNTKQFEQATAAKRTQLYNMGLREGDEAFDRAMEEEANRQTDARQQAMYGATIGAGQEAARMQGMDISAGQAQYGQQMQTANYQNTLRQQQIAEYMQQRGFSLNEINALLTGQQVGMPNMPSFNQAQRSEAAQYNQAAQSQGQYNINAYNAEQQALQGMMSGVGSIAGGAMMFSEKELKSDIYPIGKNREGRTVYLYRYTFDKPEAPFRAGLMVEENPDLVYEEPVSRRKMIDYSRVDLEVAA